MKSTVFLFLLAAATGMYAQNWTPQNQVFSFTAGLSDQKIEHFASANGIDFMEYMDDEPVFGDFVTVKFGYHFDFLSNMSADIKIILLDDLVPDNFDVSTHYFFNKHFGLGAGSLLSKTFVSGFEQYQRDLLPGDYLLNDGDRFWTVYDLGFYVSPVFKFIDTDKTHLSVRIDVGLSRYSKNTFVFYHKKKNSNEITRYRYEITPDFQPYIRPELNFRYRIFKTKLFSAGFLFRTNYYYARRSMDYRLTIQKWTYDNKQTQTVHSPKHRYWRLDLDTGVFVRW